MPRRFGKRAVRRDPVEMACRQLEIGAELSQRIEGIFVEKIERPRRDRLDQQPGCLNVVDVTADGRACLVLFNDISHYAAERRPRAALQRRA